MGARPSTRFACELKRGNLFFDASYFEARQMKTVLKDIDVKKLQITYTADAGIV